MDAFHDAARRIAHVVESMPRGTRWFIHCDSDADGLTAAAVVATSLRRLGHQYQVRSSREKDGDTYRALADVEATGLFVLDKGTSHVDVLGEVHAALGGPVVIIDHHNILDKEIPDGVHLLNPRMVGLDGSHDASSSTAAVAFARALDPRNADQGPIGLVGAIGDWQHEGGWRGWNADLVKSGLKHGHLDKRPQLAFVGMNLADALARWTKPALPGLSGDPDAARAFLVGIGVDPNVDNESLGEEDESTVISALLLHGVVHGLPPEILDTLVRPELSSTRLRTGLRRLFRIVDACGREGKTAVGLLYLMGDQAATEEAHEIFHRYRSTIDDELKRLHEQGAEQFGHVQRFAIDRDAYTGMVAGIGMTHVVTDRARPLIVQAPRPDGRVQISARGLEPAVQAGLDLGAACRQAAQSIGENGGGHPVAAGAVIPADRVDDFIAALDGFLAKQEFIEATA